MTRLLLLALLLTACGSPLPAEPVHVGATQAAVTGLLVVCATAEAAPDVQAAADEIALAAHRQVIRVSLRSAPECWTASYAPQPPGVLGTTAYDAAAGVRTVTALHSDREHETWTHELLCHVLGMGHVPVDGGWVSICNESDTGQEGITDGDLGNLFGWTAEEVSAR